MVPAARALQTAGMDVIEQNKNTVTSFIDALFTKGDLGAVDDCVVRLGHLNGSTRGNSQVCRAGLAVPRGGDLHPYALRVTTVFRHGGGVWKVVHRRGDPFGGSARELLAGRKE